MLLSLFHRVHVSPTCRPVHAENSVRGSLPLLLCIFAYAFRAVVWPVEVAWALCCSLRLEVIKLLQNGQLSAQLLLDGFRRCDFFLQCVTSRGSVQDRCLQKWLGKPTFSPDTHSFLANK